MTDIPEIATLSMPEKILFVEDLWESIASDESGVPMPQSHREELDRRLERHEKELGKLLSLDERQARIESRQ